jgi:hypothetical protein
MKIRTPAHNTLTLAHNRNVIRKLPVYYLKQTKVSFFQKTEDRKVKLAPVERGRVYAKGVEG